jgi:hypothetical protein
MADVDTDEEFEAFLAAVLAMGAEKYLRELWNVAPEVIDDMARTVSPEEED